MHAQPSLSFHSIFVITTKVCAALALLAVSLVAGVFATLFVLALLIGVLA